MSITPFLFFVLNLKLRRLERMFRRFANEPSALRVPFTSFVNVIHGDHCGSGRISKYYIIRKGDNSPVSPKEVTCVT